MTDRVIIIVLIILNLLLLSLIYEKSDDYQHDNLLSQTNYENVTNISDGLSRINSSGLLKNTKIPNIVTFINFDGCPTCLETELIELKKIANDELSNLYIVALNYDGKKNEVFDKITLTKIDYKEWLSKTNVEVHLVNPISIVFDSNYLYHYRYVDVSKPFEKELTEAFYLFSNKFYR